MTKLNISDNHMKTTTFLIINSNHAQRNASTTIEMQHLSNATSSSAASAPAPAGTARQGGEPMGQCPAPLLPSWGVGIRPSVALLATMMARMIRFC